MTVTAKHPVLSSKGTNANGNELCGRGLVVSSSSSFVYCSLHRDFKSEAVMASDTTKSQKKARQVRFDLREEINLY